MNEGKELTDLQGDSRHDLIDFLRDFLKNDGEQILTVTFGFKKLIDLHDSFIEFLDESNLFLVLRGILLIFGEYGQKLILDLIVIWLLRREDQMLQLLYPLLDTVGVVLDYDVQLGQLDHLEIKIYL